ncbi:hypothetical protein AX16_006305 [Volvariella volvacea WC 439]|nr:hypothetical protein AX16_006305 [Volvariella volvacea WC 439]
MSQPEYQPVPTKHDERGPEAGWIWCVRRYPLLCVFHLCSTRSKVQDQLHLEKLLKPSVYWPLLIIAGQLILVITGWMFFAKNATHPTPLPKYLAEQAQRFPPAMTFIVTCISTLISVCSSVLYSNAVRYALALRLSRPMPLHHLSIGVKIARERTLLSWRFMKWTAITFFSITLLGAQTTAWTTLLTPAKISLPADVSGYALDISNPEVYRLVANLTRTGELYPDAMIVVAQTIQASGVAAINAEFGLPGDIINFNQVTFVNSTGGIMPMFLRNVRSVLNSTSHYSSTLNVNSGVESPRGFATSFEVIQQGITVRTTCKERDPGNVETRSQNLTVGLISLTGVVLDVVCPDGSVMIANETTSVLTRIPVGRSEGSTVLASACMLPNHPGSYGNAFFIILCHSPTNPGEEFVIHAVGDLYPFIGTLSCEMIPKLTSVRVKYTESVSEEGPYTVTASILDVLEEREIEDGDIAVAPFTFLSRGFQARQAWCGPSDSAYLTGVFEFCATLMQAALTRSSNKYLPDKIPIPMRRDTSGTLLIETIGWDFRASARPGEKATGVIAAALLIPTFVAMSTIAFTLIAVINNRQRALLQYQVHIDTGELLQVIGTTQPDKEFPTLNSTEGELMEYSRNERLQVRLQKDIRNQIEMVIERE